MTIFTCVNKLEAMLSCIYDAWTSKIGHQNIRLMIEPIHQYTLFDEYIHVDADAVKAEKVMDAVCQKISPEFYRELMYISMAYEDDALDTIYRCMILGFAYGREALRMVQYAPVMRYQQIYTRLGKEINRFQEFLRFHKIQQDIYVAHFEPKSRICVALGPIFEDRMPSENWMIINDITKNAVIHPKNTRFFVRSLSDNEYERLLETEHANDEVTKLWKTFFHSIAIKERENKQLQRSLYPLWTRKHAIEFTE